MEATLLIKYTWCFQAFFRVRSAGKDKNKCVGIKTKQRKFEQKCFISQDLQGASSLSNATDDNQETFGPKNGLVPALSPGLSPWLGRGACRVSITSSFLSSVRHRRSVRKGIQGYI